MLRPDRWRSALRLQFTSDIAAANLLASIGDRQDAAALRSAAATHRWLRPAAVEITRRLAREVEVEDLGVVRILFGGRPITRPIRRKVVALLCFLSSRKSMAATKDEALEALWPDLGAATATNSLHQTIYYLRRVFEPDFREGISAGYVQFDGDVVTLSDRLVDSPSRACWRLVWKTRAGDTTSLDRLDRGLSGCVCPGLRLRGVGDELPGQSPRGRASGRRGWHSGVNGGG